MNLEEKLSLAVQYSLREVALYFSLYEVFQDSYGWEGSVRWVWINLSFSISKAYYSFRKSNYLESQPPRSIPYRGIFLMFAPTKAISEINILLFYTKVRWSLRGSFLLFNSTIYNHLKLKCNNLFGYFLQKVTVSQSKKLLLYSGIFQFYNPRWSKVSHKLNTLMTVRAINILGRPFKTLTTYFYLFLTPKK